jgi:hypothetical protein
VTITGGKGYYRVFFGLPQPQSGRIQACYVSAVARRAVWITNPEALVRWPRYVGRVDQSDTGRLKAQADLQAVPTIGK